MGISHSEMLHALCANWLIKHGVRKKSSTKRHDVLATSNVGLNKFRSRACDLMACWRLQLFGTSWFDKLPRGSQFSSHCDLCESWLGGLLGWSDALPIVIWWIALKITCLKLCFLTDCPDDRMIESDLAPAVIWWNALKVACLKLCILTDCPDDRTIDKTFANLFTQRVVMENVIDKTQNVPPNSFVLSYSFRSYHTLPSCSFHGCPYVVLSFSFAFNHDSGVYPIPFLSLVF